MVQETEEMMGTFTTKLSLGGPAFILRGDLDPYYVRVTVGQIRVIETLPSARHFDDEPCYKEEYMCVETGVGSGNIWTYGLNIFATEAEAEHGVIARRQMAHKQRAERDAREAERAKLQRERELRTLKDLQAKYQSAGVIQE